jgi:MFS family permease
MSSPPNAPQGVEIGRQRRRAIVASTVGTSIEYYDFFLYGCMAGVVFPTVFFPASNTYAGILQSFATFAFGFVARPIGGAVFGHYGDKLGRKTTLMVTLSLMAVGTVLIGLVPSYHQIGAWSGVLLVALRFVQGLGVGGEWGGSVLLAMEWAKPNRRGLAAAWPQAAVPIGLLLANGAIALTMVCMPHQQFMTWGWRVPFLLSVVMFGVGIYIRRRVVESPAFSQVAATRKIAVNPLREVVRRNWREIGLCALLSVPDLAAFYIFAVFIFAFAKQQLHLEQSFVTVAVMTGAAISVFAMPLFGYLSDRVGRRRVYFTALVLLAVWAWMYYALLNTGAATLVFAAIAISFIAHAMCHGPQGALLAESFGTRVRYSGVSLGYQLSSVMAGATAPLIALALYHHDNRGSGIAAYMFGIAVIGAVATALLRTRTDARLHTDVSAPSSAEIISAPAQLAAATQSKEAM